jgi:uncharacterized protein YqhQ
MPERRVYYGGQAVLEGVMIRGPRSMAVACRRPDGAIAVRQELLRGVYTSGVRRVPFIRGALVMWETLALGIRSLIFSSNVAAGEEDRNIDAAAVWTTLILSLLLVAGLFFVVPAVLAGWLDEWIESEFVVVLVEGLVRLAMIVAYIGLIGLVPDIRRVYAYHGAEHKTIHALEHGEPLTPAFIQKHSTAHVRCGTSFLLTVVIVSIFVFGLVGNPDFLLRVLSRVLLIPVIAAIAYEVIRLGGAFERNPVTRLLMWPNLALQALTTRQPDDEQVEVAVRALNEVLAAEKALERAEPAETAEATEELQAAPPLD